MPRRPKDIGTAFTTAVIRYLHTDGFGQAELRNQAGANDKGDITGMPGIVIECKGGKAAEDASDAQVAAWLAETERERANARADVGLLVTKRRAIGAARAGQWWAHMTLHTVIDLTGINRPLPDDVARIPVRFHLADAVQLLRAHGYGDPFEPELCASAVSAANLPIVGRAHEVAGLSGRARGGAA